MPGIKPRSSAKSASDLDTESPLHPNGEIILMTSFEVGRPFYSWCQISWWDPGLHKQRKVMSQAAPHVAVPGDTPTPPHPHTHCFLFAAILTSSKLLWLSYLSASIPWALTEAFCLFIYSRELHLILTKYGLGPTLAHSLFV